ncbi:cytochrome P450 [Amycolatopsis sp. NBC_01286]|uniref:cytochrome P450 n=1 Tax=Amycolatopsis sp. NBC_01286 TaxID=2903560 RepID=UPI002E144952|nr:cytochrome P450 [Amycolatopsis sp. NBC_01286]
MDTTASYPFNHGDGLALDDAYAEARERPGLTRVRLPFGEPGWLVTRYADARQVLGDRRFSTQLGTQHDWPRVIPMRAEMGILGLDAPDHPRLRRLVAKAFTAARVEQLRPWVRTLARELLSGLKEQGGTADLVDQFALPFSVQVICELLGVPPRDRPKFRVWTDWVFSTTPISPEEFMANHAAFRGYMASLVEARREEPRDDLISALIRAQDDEDRISADELVDLGNSLLLAGHETTAAQVGNFVDVLLHTPGGWQRLLDDPDLVPSAVEELTRFVPLMSGSVFPRYAAEDIEVGGTLVPAGEGVLVSLGSADRDPARFGEPDTLDLGREQNPHLGYSHGAHHCFGAALARVELQEALRALLDLMPALRVTGEIAWKPQVAVRGVSKYVVGW